MLPPRRMYWVMKGNYRDDSKKYMQQQQHKHERDDIDRVIAGCRHRGNTWGNRLPELYQLCHEGASCQRVGRHDQNTIRAGNPIYGRLCNPQRRGWSPSRDMQLLRYRYKPIHTRYLSKQHDLYHSSWAARTTDKRWLPRLNDWYFRSYTTWDLGTRSMLEVMR